MPKAAGILDRYVIRETIAPFLMALAVFTFLFAVRPMMDNAQALLTKGVPVGTVVYLLANLLPQALGITLPMALLIGLLMASGASRRTAKPSRSWRAASAFGGWFARP